jgi:hypothetical protein
MLTMPMARSYVIVQVWAAVPMPPETTVTGIVGGVAVAGGVAEHVNEVADTKVVGCATPPI